MSEFDCIDSGVAVSAAHEQILEHASLWGENPDRITFPNSPHAQSQDIWLRFRPRRELVSPANFGEPHFAEFYPAWHKLTRLHNIVFRVMALERAVYLGGILITKLPPGASILPHADRGWHPEFLDSKVYVIIAANDQCLNRCGGRTVIMRPGECWRFNNLITHSVDNRGDTDRIAMIITMRTT